MSDHDAFDSVMRANDTAVVVVTAADGREVDACLVGFHSQCSIEPVRYALWLSKANHTYRIACATDVLTAHWLRADDHALAAAAGGVTLDEDRDKMRRIAWHRDERGAIRLDDAAGGFSGRVVGRHDDGDHVCFVLEPLDAWWTAGSVEPAPAVLRLAAVAHLRAGHPVD
jgi:flavin reductase (DIM6/NTAB) family NADH-FMN oxidoreductase RutF